MMILILLLCLVFWLDVKPELYFHRLPQTVHKPEAHAEAFLPVLLSELQNEVFLDFTHVKVLVLPG